MFLLVSVSLFLVDFLACVDAPLNHDDVVDILIPSGTCTRHFGELCSAVGAASPMYATWGNIIAFDHDNVLFPVELFAGV